MLTRKLQLRRVVWQKFDGFRAVPCKCRWSCRHLLAKQCWGASPSVIPSYRAMIWKTSKRNTLSSRNHFRAPDFSPLSSVAHVYHLWLITNTCNHLDSKCSRSSVAEEESTLIFWVIWRRSNLERLMTLYSNAWMPLTHRATLSPS